MNSQLNNKLWASILSLGVLIISNSGCSDSPGTTTRQPPKSKTQSPIKLTCTSCMGTGYSECPHCVRGMVTNSFGPNYQCGVCRGTGKIWCHGCAGQGRR